MVKTKLWGDMQKKKQRPHASNIFPVMMGRKAHSITLIFMEWSRKLLNKTYKTRSSYLWKSCIRR